MSDISTLSNTELRDELQALGVNTGPIVGTTRRLYETKLAKLRKEGAGGKSKVLLIILDRNAHSLINPSDFRSRLRHLQ